MEDILKFLGNHFQNLLKVSLTASIVILFVIAIRLLLKRAPKIFSYALWGIVLLRLLVPVSIESPVSVVPELVTAPKTEIVAPVSPGTAFELPEEYVADENRIENIPITVPSNEPVKQTPKSMDIADCLPFIWIFGVASMVLYSAVSYRKLQKRVRAALPIERGIYIADNIDTPFVMGLFRPVVYLPGVLTKTEQAYILAHEQHHIRRGDHVFKALGFLALAIYWFNPLVWVAFILAGRDMEMSCDEAVIRKLGADIRANYSASLLNLATGHRVFSITPLAFGEGNPTGRVRNLARWRKPALWVTIICAVLCAALAVCLLTDRETPAETEPPAGETELTEKESAESDAWGVVVNAEEVSRTGATASFLYNGEPDTLSYDDFFSLERLSDGVWVPVSELPEYTATVVNSVYPLYSDRRMVHRWSDRFGELPDGHYRLGKKIIHNGTGEERIAYGQFSIPESIPVDPLPLEALPERYSAEDAARDGCFVQRNGVANDNKAQFQSFYARTQSSKASFIRVVDWSVGDLPDFIYDIHFDGSLYTVTWLENGKRESRQFQYLKYFTGKKEAHSSAGYDAYEHYVLVNDNSLTWERIQESMHSSPENVTIDYMRVYSDYIKYQMTVELPEHLTQAVLKFEGKPLLTVTNTAQLEGIYQLFQGADILGYEPKTHSTGVQLHLVLSFKSGETVTIDLDPDRDICRIGGEFVFYGAFDEPYYIEKLWRSLGISAWPDAVYAKYPRAFRLLAFG